MPSLGGVAQTLGAPPAYPSLTIHFRITIPHHELLRLPGHCHGQLLHDAHVLRYLEVRDLPVAKRNHLLGRQRGTLVRHHPGADPLAVLRTRDAEHLRLADGGMSEQIVLHLARIDVLAGASQSPSWFDGGRHRRWNPPILP